MLSSPLLLLLLLAYMYVVSALNSAACWLLGELSGACCLEDPHLGSTQDNLLVPQSELVAGDSGLVATFWKPRSRVRMRAAPMMVRMVSTTKMEMAVIQREEGSVLELALEDGKEVDWRRGEGGENGELVPSSPRLATITE